MAAVPECGSAVLMRVCESRHGLTAAVGSVQGQQQVQVMAMCADVPEAAQAGT